MTLTWDEVAVEPGWCKLDWIVADPKRRALANASNMLDVTWEAPDGEITPLDGFVDPYFQEVYLEPESLPLFQKLIGELATDSVEIYVCQLEHEVVKYATKDISWGKVARRLYNIFRLTGRYAEAVYLRELFDEPTTVLYQVAAMVRTLDEADRPGAELRPGAPAPPDRRADHVGGPGARGSQRGGDGPPPPGAPGQHPGRVRV